MFNKRLIQAFPKAFVWIKKNVFFQWLALLASCLSTLSICYIAVHAMNPNQQGLLLAAGLVVLCLLLRMGFNTLAQRASQKTSSIIKIDMREKLYDKLCALGSAYLSRFHTSEIVSLTTEGVEQLEVYFAQYLPQFFYALLAPLTLFVIVCFLCWPAALVLLICVPLIPASIVAVQKFAKKLLSRYWDSYTGLSDGFLENLRALTTLKLYSADEAYHHKMNEQAEQFRKMTMRVLIMQLNSISVMDLVAYGGSAAGILTALAFYFGGSLSLFGMLAIVLLSAEFFLPMRTLGSYFHISMNGSAAADKMFALLDLPVPERSEPLKEPGAPIEASHLHFAYADANGKEALRDISFSIPRRGLTGIVGESGSGKSTLAGLLSGRYVPTSGSLKIGDQDISSIEKESLQSGVALLSSRSTLFKGTLRDNLKAAGATDEKQMLSALEKTRILDFVNENGGLDFQIEEDGSNLSGGQKQRIAFARLLVSNPQTIVLDEATSSVDAASEALLVELAKGLAKEHQVLFITHRLANAADADQILVFKNGTLAESGPAETLAHANGEYARLLAAQNELESYVKEGYDDEEDE